MKTIFLNIIISLFCVNTMIAQTINITATAPTSTVTTAAIPNNFITMGFGNLGAIGTTSSYSPALFIGSENFNAFVNTHTERLYQTVVLGHKIFNNTLKYNSSITTTDGGGCTILGSDIGNQNNTSNTFFQSNTIVGSKILTNASISKVYFSAIFGNGAAQKINSSQRDVIIGYLGATNYTSGEGNTFIGANTDVVTSTINNSTALGNGAKTLYSNHMTFGNGDVTYWGFGMTRTGATSNAVEIRLSGGNYVELTGGGAWNYISAMNTKSNITKLNKLDVLNKINDLFIARWNYKNSVDEYHIGPMAEDFYDAFNVGTNNKHISTIDPSGVALVGIQALYEIIKTKETEINSLKSAVSSLKSDYENICNLNCMIQKQSIILNESTLSQNIPNPFGENTSINFDIKGSFKTASIMIADLNGRMIQNINITSADQKSVNVDAASLYEGIFKYSLIIDANVIDTKSMSIIKN